ncbi:MAG: GNAT family N-acetyltransferase [Synergistaceae bacterium]|jgi:GNAT superfamily N-acetyltransferase|nr:GNAT family N-acetyltransferase [Synergistaceae bacterium]
MNGDKMVYENLNSLLGVMGNFPDARYGAMPGVTLCDSGVDDAYENYALLEDWDSAKQSIEHGLEFFRRNGHPHIWPLFPWIPDEACRILEGFGLVRDEDFQAMTAETQDSASDCANRGVTGPIRGDGDAREWAACAWSGFDSDGDPPEPFISNARNMARHGAFSLMHADGRATGMLFAAEKTCGIYYVATHPKHRGHGLAGTIAENLKSRALRLGFKYAALLATPSGRRLYLKHGFSDGGTVKIYKAE